jgi:hypothetical protein
MTAGSLEVFVFLYTGRVHFIAVSYHTLFAGVSGFGLLHNMECLLRRIPNRSLEIVSIILVWLKFLNKDRFYPEVKTKTKARKAKYPIQPFPMPAIYRTRKKYQNFSTLPRRHHRMIDPSHPHYYAVHITSCHIRPAIPMNLAGPCSNQIALTPSSPSISR